VSIYYQDDRVHVTSSEVWMGGRHFALDDLEFVWHKRGRPNRRVLHRRTLRVLLVLSALVLIAAWAARTPALLTFGAQIPSILIRIALLGAGSVAFLALAWPLAELVLSGLDHVYLHGVVVHEIWARCQGEDVLLLRTSDSLRFGRVYRALERALENHPG
jgi:hypothetical protein